MMFFWCFMLLMALLIPLSMIFWGRRLLKHPPKEINALFGYRTKRSMMTYASWDFAQCFCGRLWIRIGCALLPFSILPMLLVIHGDIDTIGWVGSGICLLEILPLLLSILPVEKALKREFDDYGRRRAQ